MSPRTDPPGDLKLNPAAADASPANAVATGRVYTGRGRRKQTRFGVRVADHFAKWAITVGGIGTIAAVSLVFLFLFSVVAPLFQGARLEIPAQRELQGLASHPLAWGLDDFRTTAWWVQTDGQLAAYRVDTGERLLQRPVWEGSPPTRLVTLPGQSQVVGGQADGSVRLGTINFTIQFVPPEEVPEEIQRQLNSSRIATWDGGILERTSQGQFRRQTLETTWSAPLPAASAEISAVDLLLVSGEGGIGNREWLLAAAARNGQVRFGKVVEQKNELTGESTLQPDWHDLPVTRRGSAELIQVLVAGRGDNLYVIWNDGVLQRHDIRDPAKPVKVEEVDLAAGANTQVTAVGFLLGRETLVCGDSQGGLRAWFRVRQAGDTVGDGQRLTMVHDLTRGTVPVSTWRPSDRGRLIAVGYTDGSLRVFQVTTEQELLHRPAVAGSGLLAVALAPKEDGLFALGPGTMWSAQLDPRHPEATWRSLFQPVWYEGYDRPQHTWQSSFSTSAPEMKLGLVPLIHGTLKATFYAMMFAAPLALLAAVFSSEFLHPRLRTVVKPAIEMMASLPSVVLGFLAALVLAAMVETYVARVLSTFFCIPVAFLLAAYLWQGLPESWCLRLQPWRFWFLPIPLAGGIALSVVVGDFAERLLFAGNILRWLDGQIGNGIGAWMILLLPTSAVVVGGLVALVVNPWLRRIAEGFPRGQFVVLNLLKFLAALAVTLLIAYLVSWGLNALGLDPRGTYVSTYVQRNAFVVGMVMGFAVIPIIFTIADDALGSVPQHLRSASLACGATPWQTALRVVVPTAASGLFSAVMIGLGRAVGETMIVLMAGGNTPIMEWNAFEGFRTLSANIAVELSEAVRDSTHYRTLFLSALTLFLMTFVVNTIAEVVRLRFRKRAFQL